MSTTPTRPEMPQAEQQAPAYGTPRWIPILFVILFLLGGYLIFAGVHAGQGIQSLQSQMSQSNQQVGQLGTTLQKTGNQLDDLKAELDLTSQKLGLTQAQLEQAKRNAVALRREQVAASTKLQDQIGQVQQQTQAGMGQLSTELGGAKNDIATTKSSLDETRAKLDTTVGDMGVMSGLVAHNKAQVEQLIRLGQRNYYEFDLHRAKFPSRVGPIMIQLSKADAKHWRYTMNVTVEDKRIEKKDKTLFEPVQFYTSKAPAPLEIVVYQINKNEAVGYLSTPKEQGAQGSASPTTQQ
ncbi:MAG TPA: hypothetical protein VGS20_15245 [Candidatus Acidoferrales bacterium]|nr:hypothetical protein [Candidatus Acidoferrales bacterium]